MENYWKTAITTLSTTGMVATQTLFMSHTKRYWSKHYSRARKYADLRNITKLVGISEHAIIILVYYCYRAHTASSTILPNGTNKLLESYTIKRDKIVKQLIIKEKPQSSPEVSVPPELCYWPVGCAKFSKTTSQLTGFGFAWNKNQIEG